MNKEEAIREAVLNGKKIRHKGWHAEYYIQFDFTHGVWINYRGTHTDISIRPTYDWEIYEEPKPKIKKWIWCISSDGFSPYNTSTYLTEEEIRTRCNEANVDIRKLEYTEQEFDA